MLELRDVSAGYDRTAVLHGVSFTVGAGERVGLFGPNGHGKTTLLRTVSGLVSRRSGDVLLEGRSIAAAAPHAIARRGLVHVPQAGMLFPELTVRENLLLAARAQKAGSAEKERLERVEAIFPRVAERRNQRCRTLSGGERQMVAIGVGLMAAPRLLMLDEPTLGLSPKLKEELGSAIEAVVATGLSLLLVEQDIQFLAKLTDRLLMIEQGRLRLELDARSGIDEAGIMDHYFGRHAAA